ncbi:MAG: hypothetical protein H6Q90_7039 [Deltaproteobacteria bacterium]|nr:hypothetical protein [Deltaproteobacteria bacterium]
MKQRLYLFVSLWSVFAGAGCAQLLGIEDSSSGDTVGLPVDARPNTSTDAPMLPGDGPMLPGDGPSTTACAPLPSFGPVTKYGLVDSIALAVGDVNRDGFKDIVVVTRSSTASNVVIFDGSPNGTFGASRQLHPGSPTTATGVLIADVDADGSQDIVTWNGMSPIPPIPSFTVSVHRQSITAAGTFLAAQTFSVPGVAGVVAGKLNGDTRADLVIQSGSSGDTFPYFASTTTAGAFTQGALIATGMMVSHVTDIDQDGLDDVAFSRMAGGLAISFNVNAQTPGTFTPAAVGAGSADNASFGHYSGSATRLDVVMFGDAMPTVGVLYAQTSPRVFEQRSALVDGVRGFTVHTPGNGMKTLDLNTDGRDDVVGDGQAEIQCPTPGTFFPSRSAGTEIRFGDMLSPPEVAVFSDINGNGKLDLIDLPTNGISSAFVEVWLQ